MNSITHVMKVRSELIQILNNSGLTIDTALLMIKDIYNELYISGLQAQIAHGENGQVSSEQEEIEIQEVTENGE